MARTRPERPREAEKDLLPVPGYDPSRRENRMSVRFGKIYIRPGTHVVLSSEGAACLRPQWPLHGVVMATVGGLITVKDETGKEAEYHPDFIERDARRYEGVRRD